MRGTKKPLKLLLKGLIIKGDELVNFNHSRKRKRLFNTCHIGKCERDGVFTSLWELDGCVDAFGVYLNAVSIIDIPSGLNRDYASCDVSS